MSVLDWAEELQDFIDGKDWHGAYSDPRQVIKLFEAKAEIQRAIERLRSLEVMLGDEP